MKTAQGRTVSTYSDPSPTENGPCCIQEDDGYDIVRQVAAKVVEDVVTKAAEVAEAATRLTQQPELVKPIRGPCLQRLPTIQIDTVPSMPPSPTDWPPPPDDVLLEEEEPVDQSQIEIEIGPPSEEPGSNISEEIKKFAASYVQDILYKAISLAEEKFLAQESSRAREMAEQVVEEVITKAAETASEKLEQKMSPVVITPPSSLSFSGLPTIQIDTVASMPPSPEDKDEVEAQQQPEKRTQNQKIPGITIDEPEDDIGKIKLNLISYADAPQELREFAASYVKDIISRAISTADEKLVPTVPFNFEDVDLMKTSGPWYIRAREALMRVLRIACFCTPRRNDS